MSWNEEDFYREPSEFDAVVEELKAELMKSVKDEFVTEMKHLRTENAELQEVKRDFEKIKQDYEFKKNALEIERNNLERKIRGERLVELSKDHKAILYRATSKRELPLKCNNCDKNRRVKYTTPLGRETSEDCSCREGKIVYSPREVVRYEFKISRDRKGLTAWYRQYSDDDDGFVMDDSILAENIYSPEMEFKELSAYRTFFKTEEACKAYCDHLNEKPSQ